MVLEDSGKEREVWLKERDTRQEHSHCQPAAQQGGTWGNKYLDFCPRPRPQGLLLLAEAKWKQGVLLSIPELGAG